MKHAVVYHAPGVYAAWPANGGIWSWGDEILVSFHEGSYLYTSDSHSIDRQKPIYASFARSLDGGLNWQYEGHLEEIFTKPTLPVPEGGFDFSNPDFILRMGKPAVTILDDRFIVSSDRGHTWQGPYRVEGLAGPLTNRTAYLVEGPKTMLAFMSYQRPNDRKAAYSDEAFTAVTTDGAQSWRMLGRMTADVARSVMPSVAKLSDGTMVAALRRRITYGKCTKDELNDFAKNHRIQGVGDDNWIEVCTSRDGGKTWQGHVRAADTTIDEPGRDVGGNGNPPALVTLADDTLVLVYGYRGKEPSMRVCVSRDKGKTFGPPRTLRSDAAEYDIGYPRAVVRPDGKIVAVYYYVTEKMHPQFIASTVFDVAELEGQ